MRTYAAEKRLVLLEVDTGLSSALASRLKSLHEDVGVLPSILIFHVKDGADLDDSGKYSLDPDQANIVAGFVYRGSRTINGVTIPAQDKLTFDSFRRLVESYFPNNYWPSINPSTLTGYQNAIDLGRLPSADNPPAAGAWVVTSPTSGAHALNGATNETWFKFTGVPGRRYFFYATQATAPSGVAVDCAIFASLNGTPVEPAMKSASGDGFSRLDRGFYVDIASAGTYYLRVSRPANPAVTGVGFVLKAHETVAQPAAGTATNPRWSGAAPGQWTMDWEAARTASAATGKPLLVAFSGVRWCPWCIGMENQTLGSPQFASRTSNSYLVLVDNRRRGETTGPSLLTDDSPGGYLAANGISIAVANAKLQANIALQNQLALPGATISGGYAKIGYPTLLYLRPDGSVVGRVSYTKLQDPGATAACLEQLAALAADAGEERDNYASSTAGLGRDSFADLVVLATPVPDGAGAERPAKIGGVDERDWRVFSPPGDGGVDWSRTAWMFRAQALAANPDATATLAVYDASGLADQDGLLLISATGSLKNGVRLDFVPGLAGTYRLLLEVAGQNEVVDYTLAYSTRTLGNQIAFVAPVFAAAQATDKATATVTLRIETANDGPLTFDYWTEAIDGGAIADTHFATVAPTEITIDTDDKIDGAVFELEVPLLGQSLPPWAGSRDFRLILAPRQNCWIDPEAATAIVKIYSRPTFDTQTVDLLLAQYVAMAPLALPVYSGLPGTLEVKLATGALPPGLKWTFTTTSPYAGTLTLDGTPTQAGEFLATFEAASILGNGTRTAGNTIAIRANVQPLAEINPHGLPGRVFAGPLFAPANTRQAKVVAGAVNLAVAGDGSLIATIATGDGEVECRAANWKGLGDAGELLATLTPLGLEHPSLTITLATDGHGTGRYLTESGHDFEATLLPVPWSQARPADQFKGFYTVGLPVADDSPGPYQGIGYLSFIIDELGEATYTGCLADGTPFAGTSTLAAATSGNQTFGRLTIFNRLAGNGQASLAGILEILSRNDRFEDEASVSSCDVDWLWRQADGLEVFLEPCGNEFDRDRSLTAQRDNTPNFYLTVAVSGARPADWGDVTVAFLPTEVEFAEGDGDSLTAVASPSPANPSLAYDRQTARFTGEFTLFFANPDGSVATRSATMAGILTPAGSGCCSIESLPVGQGFCLVDTADGPRSYPVVLAGFNVAPQTATPEPDRNEGVRGEPSADGYAIHVRFAGATETAIFLIKAAGTRADGWRTALPGQDVGLDLGAWQVVAGAAGLPSSAPFEFAIQAEDLRNFILDAASWPSGWNLVAMPDWKWIDQTTSAGILARWPAWGVNSATGKLMRAETLLPGRAYWFLLADEQRDGQPEITGIAWPDGEPSTNWRPSPAWNLVAKPADLTGVLSGWKWLGHGYRLLPPAEELPPDEGGWFYYRQPR